jgi:hypothetical protein
MPASIQRKSEGAARKTSGSRVHPAFERLRLSERSMGFAPQPNKAPEPTAGSLTPRATLLFSELNQWTVIPKPARVVPAPAVAHL